MFWKRQENINQLFANRLILYLRFYWNTDIIKLEDECRILWGEPKLLFFHQKYFFIELISSGMIVENQVKYKQTEEINSAENGRQPKILAANLLYYNGHNVRCLLYQ